MGTIPSPYSFCFGFYGFGSIADLRMPIGVKVHVLEMALVPENKSLPPGK